MDDQTRFDQLEEVIVELLRKQDRTIEEVSRLREAVAAQHLLLSQMQSDLHRLEAESTATRRLANDTIHLLNRGFEEFATALARHERLLQETATILASHEIFQQETREALAENRIFQQETREALVENREFQSEMRDFKTEMKSFQQETQTALTKILELLTNSH